MPTWPACAHKMPQKGGRSLRNDPAHGAGGASPDLGDDRTLRRARLPAGVVAVAQGSPGGCQALPRCQARRPSAETTRRREAGARNHGYTCPPHRRPVDQHRGVAAAKRGPWQAVARPPHGDRRDALGSIQRCFVEGPARGGVRAVADDLLPVQQMVQRGSLARDTRSAPVSAVTPSALASRRKCRCRTKSVA
jgi:hypothetical protein